jgi:hypothetical protein
MLRVPKREVVRENPVITLKTVGHQWYWSYEYSDFTKLEFDSYIVQQEDHQINTFRLLDTDNRIVLPINSPILIIITAADVLHSWTVPRLGVKTDATPGLNNRFLEWFGFCPSFCLSPSVLSLCATVTQVLPLFRFKDYDWRHVVWPSCKRDRCVLKIPVCTGQHKPRTDLYRHTAMSIVRSQPTIPVTELQERVRVTHRIFLYYLMLM